MKSSTSRDTKICTQDQDECVSPTHFPEMKMIKLTLRFHTCKFLFPEVCGEERKIQTETKRLRLRHFEVHHSLNSGGGENWVFT